MTTALPRLRSGIRGLSLFGRDGLLEPYGI